MLVFYQSVNSDGENNVVAWQWRRDEASVSEGNKRGVGEVWGVVALISLLLFEAMGQWTSQGRVMVKAIFGRNVSCVLNHGGRDDLILSPIQAK